MNQLNLPDQIKGFSRVEYLSIFIALLYAFAIAEFFVGWSRMLRYRDNLTYNFYHLLWSLVVFWASILNWYTLWQRLSFIDQGFLYFILLLLPIMLFFLSTVFLFPDFEKVQDLNIYYEKTRRIIVFLFSITAFINVLISILLHESELVAPINIIRLLTAVLGISAAIFNLRRLQDVQVYIFSASLATATVIISLSKM